MGFIDTLTGLMRKKEPTGEEYNRPLLLSNTPEFQDYSYLNDQQNYLEQYEGWTYKAINFKANSIINYVPKLYQGDGEDRAGVDDNELVENLKFFNPYQSYSEARKMTRIHLDLTGTAFWIMMESDTRDYRTEFYILDPTRIHYKTNAFGLPRLYIYRDAKGSEQAIEPQNLIVFRDPHPQNWLKGYGPLQASRYAHNTHELASKFNMNIFGNSGRPEGLLYIDSISDDERKRIQKEFKEKYGGASNARKLGIVNTKPEFIKMMESHKDLDFTKGMQQVRDEILSIHGVPKSLVGLDDSTYSNAQEAQRIYQRYTLAPMLESEVSVYNEQLLPKYFRTDRALGLTFDYDDPVEKDKDTEANIASRLYEAGVIDRAAAKRRVEEEVEDSDEGVYFTRFPVPQDNSDIEKQVREIKETVEEIPSIKKVKESNKKRERAKLKQFYFNKNLESESEFKGELNKYLDGQMERVVEDTVSKKAINMKTDINDDDEIEKGVEALSGQYAAQAAKFNEIANEMTNADVSIKEELQKFMEENVVNTVKEVNNTTKEALRKEIARIVEDDIGINEARQRLVRVYNEVVEGTKNIQTLEALGIYIDRATVNNNGKVVFGSSDRFNRMLEMITRPDIGPELTPAQQIEASKALLAILDPNNELTPQIENTIKTFYGVDRTSDGFTEARAETIARTEINKIKNFATRTNYAKNEFVTGMEWLSARDNDVRSAHASADGQVVGVGLKFRVGGEFLAYPGDPVGRADNVINCRCTIIAVM